MDFSFSNDEWIEVPLDEKMASKLMYKTKKELVEMFVNASLAAKLAEKEKEDLRTKLDKAESYVEQGRAMIEAVMDRWHEYDV